jgi:hypothetical protein
MIGSSRDFHAYRAQSHLAGQLIPVVKTNHFTILEKLRRPNAILTRAAVDLVHPSGIEGLIILARGPRYSARGFPA